MGVCVTVSVPLECSGCRVATTGGKSPPAPVGRRVPRSTIRNFNPRVPVGEAEQIVAALRARNVPVEYLRFEDEGHGLIKRANRVKAYPEVARFLDAQVKGRA